MPPDIPYKPVNVSRIRTCIFCRKSNIPHRRDRLKTLITDIKTYSETQNCLPTSEIVKSWIKLKFSVEESTVKSYLKELEDTNLRLNGEKISNNNLNRIIQVKDKEIENQTEKYNKCNKLNNEKITENKNANKCNYSNH